VHSCQLMGDRKLLWWWCHSVYHYIHLLNTLFESVYTPPPASSLWSLT
jgi:hypothetical protein